MPSALFFFLNIALAIWGLLWFHTNFRIISSISMKNAIGILIGILWNLHIVLCSMDILTVLIPLTHEHRISFHLFVSLQFPSSESCSFQCTDLSPAWSNLFLSILFILLLL